MRSISLSNALAIVALGLFAVIAITDADAATVVPGKDGCSLMLSGEIQAGDDLLLEKANAKFGDTLCLNSQGGNYVAALDIADRLPMLGITTVLKPGAQCYSACAIIFMGGSEWEEGLYFPKRKMSLKAKLGFHAPYMTPPDGHYDAVSVRAAYAVGLDAVARMMELGRGIDGKSAIPNDIILGLLKKGPSEIYSVDDAVKAKSLNIELTDVPSPEWTVREACNACAAANDGMTANNLCDTVRTSVEKDGSVQHAFFGVGGEGSYWCVFKRAMGKGGKLGKPLIANLLEDNEFPVKAKAFKQSVKASDALGYGGNFGGK